MNFKINEYKKNIKPMRFCSKCVYPESSAVTLQFDNHNICSGCKVSNDKNKIDWEHREQLFRRLIEFYKSKNNYDCIIPVSGGKDSYYQTHMIKKIYGLNPLLVTYNGNNYSKEGLENLQNMREVFGVDHIFFTPNIDVLKSLNRMGMLIMGDMNWHAHAGIFTYPIKIAVQMKIPLIVWGEHGRSDVGGMHNYDDFIEFTYRHRHEHACRGFEWDYFIKKSKNFGENLTKKHLFPWMYPSDKEIEKIGVRGIYISNYFSWNANEHIKLMKKKYNFKESKKSFERTYRKMSNLDDIHENGIHDYLKFIKFGYGRATDHCSKDIRAGLMSREKAQKIVKRLDHIKPKDLKRWLSYVNWTEEKFDEVADSFRNPRVWWIENGNWFKYDIDGKPRSYGKVKIKTNTQVTKSERL